MNSHGNADSLTQAQHLPLAVFVHGNPENPAVWGPLVQELGLARVICLFPPGFGAPLVRGFEPSMNSYRQ
jgi:pimeloyl-ACP methyl ester carboxylesterase